MNVTIFAAILFVITYVLMFAFQKIRPYVAVLSAVIFVVVGSTGIFPDFRYTVGDALGQIDWNVILMITGTMGTVFLFIESKMPQRMSDILVSHIHSVKWLVVVLSLFAGVISAFVDNVATVLMVAPVALALCKKLHISPVPAIICIAISSNLQGAATLVGDTTSILLAKAAGLDFMDFFFVIGLIREVRRSGSREIIGRAILEIDFYTLALLAGLFVVIGGISRAGIIDLLGTALAGISGDGSRGSVFIVYTVIVWMSVACSAFIDNIPYTATMLPVVAVVTERLSAAGGLAVEPNLMYFGLLVGATLGGNLTPIGASANIAGIGILRKEGYSVSSGTFMKFGVPFTLAAVISGYLLVWLIWM